MGKSLSHITRYKAMLESAGFENVVLRKYSIPLNAWPPGKQNKRLGTLTQMNIQQSIHLVSFAVFPRTLGWSKEDTEVLVNDVLKDLDNTEIHGFMTL